MVFLTLFKMTGKPSSSEATKEKSTDSYENEYWSRDDSPIVRPVVHRYPHHNIERLEPNYPSKNLDGFAAGPECQRVTKLYLRSTPQKILTSIVVVAGGLAVFGALVGIDSWKKSRNNSSNEKISSEKL